MLGIRFKCNVVPAIFATLARQGHAKRLLITATTLLVAGCGQGPSKSADSESSGGQSASELAEFRVKVKECKDSRKAKSVNLEELATWDILGPGRADIIQTKAGPAVEFRGQSPSPDAIVLLSPTKYAPKIILRFRILFKVPRSLVVMILSASAPGTGAKLTLPEQYPGWSFWGHTKTPGAQSYLFSIHTAFHQRDALLRRWPKTLHATPDTLNEEQRWYSVEMGKVGNSIWLDHSGRSLLYGTEPHPLPGGHIGFLFTGDGDARVLIRDVSILNCSDE